MKKIAFVSLAILAVACGSTHKDLESSKTASLSEPATIFFVRDDRPADGLRKELSLQRTQENTYDVSLRTMYFDRINMQAVDQTETLAQNMQCELGRVRIECKRDERPVDGLLKVLLITQTESGYLATLSTSYVDMITGKSHEETKELARRLELTNENQPNNDCSSILNRACSTEFGPTSCSLGELRASGSNRCKALNSLEYLACTRGVAFVVSEATCHQ